MDIVLKYVGELPFWIITGGGSAAVIIIAALIFTLIYRKKRKQFIKYLSEALENNSFSSDIYSEDYVKRHSKIVENFADNTDNKIIELTNLDQHWLRQLKKNPKEKDIKRILKYIPSRGLFSCFLAGLEKKSLTKNVLQFIGEEPGSLRKLPLSGSGEPFDGNAARLVFSDRMDEIREMAGDPEWSVRYFAIKLLLGEESERSERGIIEAFSDPHPLIRKSVNTECTLEDKQRLYKLLYDHLLDDPSFEVRESSYRRIMDEYRDIHSIDYDSLTPVQSLHALEFLNPEIPNDIDAALHFLEGNDLELRFPSAIFLQETGTLERMLKNVSFEDTDNLKRTTELLSNAAEVKITGFLEKGVDTPASLYTALLLLKKVGEREYISDYGLKVFNLSTDYNEKVWENAVECIRDRGNERAAIVLMNELAKVKYKGKQAEFILKNIPRNCEFLSIPTLIELLKDADFRERETLVTTIAQLPEDIIIPELF
ncbi:MAG: HEAT repeat domain-containing protein, partial [Spirochaetales bacterium]|nr:HEAT repeat domain-containing protein [Spirochaetales bacterium]